MKKIIISLIVLILLVLGWLYSYKNFLPKKEEKINTKSWSIEKEVKKETNTKVEKKELDDKIDTLKRKVKLKWLIANWDMLSSEANYLAALMKYQRAVKEIPNDWELNKKIWDIYYEMKNFKKASKYYIKIKDYKDLDKDKAIKSLINSKWVNPSNIEILKKEISSFDISKQKKYYYIISLDCVIDYSKCRDEFERYFKENKEISDENLKNIKTALKNFENFWSKDLYYKASFVSWAFFENAFYFLSLKTAEKVLKEKSDYKPMIKVAAKSAYKIWKYTLAKNYLIKNKKLDSNDPEISYFLARVYEKLNSKMLSIVHYEKAIKDWHKHPEDIYRRLIFIYFENKEIKKMIKEFDSLLSLDKSKLNETDFSLAIYYNILDSDLKKAKNYSIKAIKDFPESHIFYAYFAWILMQKEDFSKKEQNIVGKNIEKALKINHKDPMVLMTKWIYEFKRKNYNLSIIYLKKAYSLDKAAEYKSEIETWLEKVNLEKTEKNNK